MGTESYRYEFNGKERDENGEFGSLTHYDYGFRIYNPGIGKFLSVDPLTASYPWYTPYQFAGNKPIWMVDLDGLEEADPQQLKMAEQYYQKTKLKQSEVFPNISPGLINSQVKSRFRSLGNPINQGEFFLCGPAAACHITASHDQFASNRPIDGVDLDGLEFLDADEALFEYMGGNAYIKLENVSIPTKNYFTTYNSVKYNEDLQGKYMEMERPLLLKGNHPMSMPPKMARDGLAGPLPREVYNDIAYQGYKVDDNSNAKTKRRSIRSGNYEYTLSVPNVPTARAPILGYFASKFLNYSTSAFIQSEIAYAEFQENLYGEFAFGLVNEMSKKVNDPIFQNTDAISEIANVIVSGVIARPENYSEDEKTEIVEVAKAIMKMENIPIRVDLKSKTKKKDP